MVVTCPLGMSIPVGRPFEHNPVLSLKLSGFALWESQESYKFCSGACHSPAPALTPLTQAQAMTQA
jgi:hypothetical protein